MNKFTLANETSLPTLCRAFCKIDGKSHFEKVTRHGWFSARIEISNFKLYFYKTITLLK
jgi:hypothetical protein